MADKKSLKIAFMGTPDFAAAALQKILDEGFNVAAVYSQPPRPKGRGKNVQKSAVHELADKNTIPVFTPKSFKKDVAAIQEFIEGDFDVAIVAAYGLILPKDILDAPKDGCLNIHASILPRWRGASPIQRAIWEGDDHSGISIMQMDQGLDTGPVITEECTEITGATTASSLHDDLAALGGRMVVDVLSKLASGEALEAAPQDDSHATYAHLLKKTDGAVDWHQTAIEIDRQVRALNPWPGVFTQTETGKRLKIKSASLADQRHDQKPGTILDKDGHVACAQGTVLKLEIVQPENAKAMDFKAALNGGYIKTGAVLVGPLVVA